MRSFFYLTFSLILLCCAQTLLAQDIITLKTGKEIKAKVLELNDEEIKYKRFENLEGPQYVLQLSKVLKIRYENGFEEVFDVPTSPEEPMVVSDGQIEPLPFLAPQIEIDAGIGLPLGNFALTSGEDAGFARLGFYTNLSGTLPISRSVGVNFMVSYHSNALDRGDFQNSFFSGLTADFKSSTVNGDYNSFSFMPGISYQGSYQRLFVRTGLNLGLNALTVPDYNFSWVLPQTVITTRYEYRPQTSIGFSAMAGVKLLYPLSKGHLSFNLNTLFRANTVTYDVKNIVGTFNFSETVESTKNVDSNAIILGIGAGYCFLF